MRTTCQSQNKLPGDSNLDPSQLPTSEGIGEELYDISNSSNVLISKAIVSIQSIYPLFPPFKTLVDFLLIMDRQSTAFETQPHQEINFYLNIFSPFVLMALYFFKKTMHSMIFQGLCDCALPSKIEHASYYGMALATKHFFHLCHLGQEKEEHI